LIQQVLRTISISDFGPEKEYQIYAIAQQTDTWSYRYDTRDPILDRDVTWLADPERRPEDIWKSISIQEYVTFLTTLRSFFHLDLPLQYTCHPILSPFQQQPIKELS
jgi:hypothetical protein